MTVKKLSLLKTTHDFLLSCTKEILLKPFQPRRVDVNKRSETKHFYNLPQGGDLDTNMTKYAYFLSL